MCARRGGCISGSNWRENIGPIQDRFECPFVLQCWPENPRKTSEGCSLFVDFTRRSCAHPANLGHDLACEVLACEVSGFKVSFCRNIFRNDWDCWIHYERKTLSPIPGHLTEDDDVCLTESNLLTCGPIALTRFNKSHFLRQVQESAQLRNEITVCFQGLNLQAVFEALWRSAIWTWAVPPLARNTVRKMDSLRTLGSHQFVSVPRDALLLTADQLLSMNGFWMVNFSDSHQRWS